MADLRVLIVDGDIRMGGKLKKFLRGRGHEAEVVGNTQDAIGHLRVQGVDALLLEADLEDGGATQIVLAARRAAAPPRLVLMTTPRSDKALPGKLGADMLLDKPFSGKQLLRMLEGIKGLIATGEWPGQKKTTPGMPLAKNVDRPVPSSGARPSIPGRGQVLTSPRDVRLDATRPTDSQNALAAIDVPGRGAVGRPRPGRLMTIMHRAGSLEQTTFPALLYKLFANQSTGILTVHRAGSERVIYFHDGEPVYAVSNSPSDSLGAVLVNLGYLKLGQLNEALEERHAGQTLGQSLLGKGLVTSEQLLHALERQVYERVLSCFSFSTGQYVFTEDTDWLGELKMFRQNPIQLICDGVQRFVGPNILATRLQPHLKQYVVRTEKFEHFKPHFPALAAHKDLLPQIDGARTLHELTGGAGSALMEMLRLVWSLRLADMVDFLDEPRTWAERSPTKPPLPSRPPTDPSLKIQPLAAPEKASKDDKDEARASMANAVLSYYVRLGHEDHWQLLGLTKEAPVEEARVAFRKALEALPPERFDLLSDSLQEKAREVHEAIKKAYNTISEPGSRDHYLRRLEQRNKARAAHRQRRQSSQEPPRRARASASKAPGEPDSQDKVDLEALGAGSAARRASKSPPPPPTEDPEFEASQNYSLVQLRRARAAAAEHRWKDAWRHIKAAGRLNPDSQEIIVFQTWIIYNLPHENPSRQYRVCRNRIEVELSIDSAQPDAHFFMARMCEDHEELSEARQFYTSALLLDPKHAEAQLGLERIRRRALSEPPPDPEQEDDLMNRLKGWFRN